MLATPVLEERDFRRLRALIYDLTGIHLSDSKRALLTTRVGRRLRHHGLTSFAAYYDLLQAGDRDGIERVELINSVTTNKTDFFREPHHFELLRTRWIPELRARAAEGAPRKVRLWSAGCSTGEEPYSIAMTLRDHLLAVEPGWDVGIIASDIDTAVLEHAARGVYSDERMAPLSHELRRRHFQRGTGSSAGSWRVRPELRQMIDFQRINLTAGPWPFAEMSDAIFCRNVVIYFDQPTQRRLFKRFAAQLAPEGYLFVGHSESMIGVSNAFGLVGQTVHQLRRDAPAAATHRRIQIGEVFASRTPALVSTVLGSCISACLIDPVARVGGMNHFLLPAGDHDAEQPARYGVHAMELLINRIMALGGQRGRLQAKIIGASKVLSALDGTVAEKNAEFVRRFLATEGIPVIAERLGGDRPLEVCFATDTGQLRCREIVTELGALAARERQYHQESRRNAASSPSAVLF
jgi:chemotaxis protein methyltransferase CheR